MVVVNFSTEAYARPQERLKKSLEGHHYLMFNDYAQIGSPTHQESPYEFKVHAIRQASAVDNKVLWVDSSMYRVGDLSIIESIISEKGYFAEEAGHYLDTWCNAHTRDYFRLPPKTDYLMFSAGLLGLDFTNPMAYEFFTRWEQSAKNGCFKGSWEDHRHDMTCASIIASIMGWKYERGGSHLAYIGPGYSQPEKDVVFLCQGMV